MVGDLLKKEENVGLEPLIAKAASKSKLLKFQALDYTEGSAGSIRRVAGGGRAGRGGGRGERPDWNL